jgi:hypothetical protein
MDDACLGQKQVHETHPQEVERHLVGHPASVRGEAAEQVEVAPTKLVRSGGELFGCGADPGRGVLVPEATLSAPTDLRVTRDDALDERGSRARHSEDENRRLVVPSEGRVLGEEVAREPCDEPVDAARKLAPVERCDRVPYPVGGVEVFHRGAVVAQIVERLTRGEVKHHPLALRKVASFEALDNALQDGPVVVGHPFRRDEPEVRRRLPWGKLDRSLERRPGLVEAPCFEKQMAEYQLRLDAPGLGGAVRLGASDRFPQIRFGLAPSTLCGQRLPLAEQAVHAVGRRIEGLLVGRRGVLQTVLAPEDVARLPVRLCELGIERRCRAEGRESAVFAPGLRQRQPELEVYAGDGRFDLDRAAQPADRFGQTLREEACGAELVEHRRIVRGQERRLLQRRDRIRIPTGFEIAPSDAQCVRDGL